MRDFAKEIKQIRTDSGLSQAEFANAIGASQGSVSKWERGLEKPRSDMLIQIQNWYEIGRINTEGAAFDFNAIPEIIDVAMTGALLAPSEEDLFAGDVRAIAHLRLPKHPLIKGPITAWMVPRLSGRLVGFMPGSVFLTHRDNLEKPDDGERIMVRETIHNGKFVYAQKYYGSSAKGFEWFTTEPHSEETIPLSQATPYDSRIENGIFPVGIIFGVISYETARNRFWDAIGYQQSNDYSNANF